MSELNISNFIWNIADDVLRDVYVRGKYRDVILPALERAAASSEVRFVIIIPEFHGMSGGALWQDLNVSIEHLHAWKRIALVTDIEWMNLMTTLFGSMTPGEVRHFPLAQLNEAIAWAAG